MATMSTIQEMVFQLGGLMESANSTLPEEELVDIAPWMVIAVIVPMALLCCCCAVCLLSVVVILLGVVIRISKKNKKYKNLEDIDLLLQEQEAQQKAEEPRFQIDASLFHIDFKNIKLLKIIGSGGSNSQIYKAKWKERIVAIKVFKTTGMFTLEDGKHDFQEFEREVKVHSSISHPNILQFYGCSLKPPRVGICMEYAENGDLENYVLKVKYGMEEDMKKITFSEKCRILKEIASGIDHMHDRDLM